MARAHQRNEFSVAILDQIPVNKQHALVPEVLTLHDDRAVLREERVEKDRVRLLHCADKLRDAAGR